MLKNLKKLRLRKGLSQQRFADIIGVSQQSVNKYENHSIEPDIDTLISLANFSTPRWIIWWATRISTILLKLKK